MKKLLAIAFLFTSFPLWSQEASVPNEPASGADTALIQPWELMGLDAEEAVYTKAAREAARQALTSVILKAPVTLKAEAARRGQTQTIVASAKSALAPSGAPVDGGLPAAVRIVPVLCSLNEQWVLAWEVTSQGLLVAASRAVLPRPSRDELAKGEGLDKLITERMTAMWATLEKSQAIENPATALKIGLALTRNPLRHDEPSALCLNMLLSHELMKTHRVLSVVGADYDTHARDALKVAEGPQRATRRLAIGWNTRGLKRLPFNLRAEARWGEAVLASSVGSAFNLPFTLSEDLRMNVAPAVAGYLTQEAQALTLADEPQIAKINRAWVYVDRGRAWGLKMNDRLIVKDGTDAIKGHVVGFYGPGLGVQSPRGFPVTEGAIVFIRKGQDKVKIGQTFTFDPTDYPTKWPPEKTPAGP